MKKKWFCTLLVLLSVTRLSQASSLPEQLREKRQQSQKKAKKENLQIMQKATQNLKESHLAEHSLGLGKSVPYLEFLDLSGKKVALKEYWSKGPVVLLFYRGQWCPYCRLELKAYQELVSEFKNKKVQLIAVSPDPIPMGKKLKKELNLDFLILSDPDNKSAAMMGLKFKLDQDLKGLYKKMGIDLEHSHDTLPMPGTYLIDKEGVIRYSFVDPDYRYRADPQEVLAQIRKLP